MRFSLSLWASANSAAESSRLGRLVTHLRTPLYRNGYALLISSLATSGLGLVYWAVAARTFSPGAVGLNSAVISAMLLLAGLAQLSLNNVLVRFIPQAGRSTTALILGTYAASLAAAAGVTVVFLAGVDVWSPTLRFLRDQPAWAVAFTAATMIWCLFALQDAALTGLRATAWVPLENITFALAKLGLLLVVVSWWPVGGIFASWMMPVALSLLPMNGLIFARLVPRHRSAAEPAAHLSLRPVVRYAAGNYLGSVFYLASTTLLPLLVANLAGATATAYFFLPWTIATGLQMVASNLTTSLTVEAALDPARLRAFSRRVLAQILRLLVPAVVLVAAAAPLGLRLFGAGYSQAGAGLLRVLAVGALPNALMAVGLSLARVQNRPRLVVLIQGSVAVLLLGLSWWWLPLWGIIGVGWAWLVSQGLVALAVSAWYLRPALRSI